MSKLAWDAIGERLYETGVSKGVLFPFSNNAYQNGVAWNGLINVNETPEGGEANPLYADNIKYLNLLSPEDFGLTIEAYTYPEEFQPCIGFAELGTGITIRNQKRTPFGFVYQTQIGNDTDYADYGYKLHLVYGCLATTSDEENATINDDPDAKTFSWDVSTTPVAVTGFKPTSCVVIDSTKVKDADLAALEAIIFGSETADSRLPLPDEIMTIFASTIAGS